MLSRFFSHQVKLWFNFQKELARKFAQVFTALTPLLAFGTSPGVALPSTYVAILLISEQKINASAQEKIHAALLPWHAVYEDKDMLNTNPMERK